MAKRLDTVNYPRSIVGKPDIGARGCWAKIRYPRHNAFGYALYGPYYHGCKRAPRPGCLTCAQHAHHEEKARKMSGEIQWEHSGTRNGLYAMVNGKHAYIERYRSPTLKTFLLTIDGVMMGQGTVASLKKLAEETGRSAAG